MATFKSPYGKFQAFDINGEPLNGGKLYTYISGTTTPKFSYTDSTGLVTNSNPVILDSRGEADVWLDGSYTLVLKDSNDVQVWSVDEITGIGATTSGGLSQWVASGITPTYISATSFSVAGNQTSLFEVGRRIRTTNSGGVFYSTILTSVFSSVTTITTINDNGASLDSGLSEVDLGILTFSLSALPSREMSITHDMTSDANYTLTGNENLFGQLVITDTGVVLTTGRNIIVADIQRDFIVTNSTAQTLTFKTLSGTGIAIVAGETKFLACDGTNVIDALGSYSTTALMNAAITGDRDGEFRSVHVYTANNTWTKPAELKRIKVIAIGGGGGGGGAPSTTSAGGSGGGGGGNGIRYIEAGSLGATVAVTIGAGGGGGSGAAAGSNGGTTSFGAFLTCTGGTGGYYASAGTAGVAGGTSSGGTINLSGCRGGSQGAFSPHPGGHSLFGWGGKCSAAGSSGNAALGYGGGGSGAQGNSASNFTGGAGTGGIIIVEEYF